MPSAFEELYERCVSEETPWRALLKLPPECMLRIIKFYLTVLFKLKVHTLDFSLRLVLLLLLFFN